MRCALAGRAVLVTGASGSIGRRLVERVAPHVAELRMMQRQSAAGRPARRGDIGRSGASADLGIASVVIAGDVADPEAAARAAAGIDIVIHLAAEKDVTRAETAPADAVRTNVMGTAVMLEAAARAGSACFVLASSDKAAQPVGVLGATKALAERVVCAASAPQRRVGVRLGGVFPSAGSVLERWTISARAGEIAVTDPEMTRFFMSLDDAVDLLIAAAAGGPAAEILVPALPAYRLGDLAEAFARVHGVRIREIGPRSGETTHEHLIAPEEVAFARPEGGRFAITPGRRAAGAGPLCSADAPRLDAAALDRIVRTAA